MTTPRHALPKPAVRTDPLLATAVAASAVVIPMIISDRRRIMREDMSSVAAEGEYLWHPSTPN
jgi:hypothetical protein